MDRRTVVAFVGDSPEASDRVARAVDAAWNGPSEPAFRALAPTDLDANRDGEEILSTMCGVVVTAAAAADDAVTDRLAMLPSNVPVIALVDDASTSTVRALLTAGVDDVVEHGDRADIASPDPLAERLASRHLGLTDGAVRASLLHYSDRSDVEALLGALDELPPS